MDTVVLACTHFPLVQEELQAAAPRPLDFLDGSSGIARRTAWLTRDHAWPATPPEGLALFTSRNPALEAYRPGLERFGLHVPFRVDVRVGETWGGMAKWKGSRNVGQRPSRELSRA